ncbi:enoyl-CoA hydratase [Haematobacter missouriensis]|nr:enoyl-CoA hydratase/isomerase family protein [Haematobacter missouriensis]KFI32875.1 enoyl-CoA hydratase [Haematobacter missouriensis]
MIRLTETAEGAWIVTLDRPEKANALTRAMLVRLVEIMVEARRAEARAVILTGSGKVFSAGADLDEARAGLATDPIWVELSAAVAAVPGLTIAALNGTLAGGAHGMVLACDLRIAVQQATFFYPAIRLGFVPPAPDPGRLAALVGPSRARMIFLAGQRIGAEEALRWGLVDRLVPGEALMETALDLSAAALAAKEGVTAGIKALLG